ncbi:MAG TPA: hypothetical protein VEI97_18650 [bacterium]|nr:hypothetical protein [bacterium]
MDLNPLGELTELTELSLRGTAVQTPGVVPLANMAHLERLALEAHFTKLDASGLALLRSSPYLAQVQFGDSSRLDTPEPVAEVLQALADNPQFSSRDIVAINLHEAPPAIQELVAGLRRRGVQVVEPDDVPF